MPSDRLEREVAPLAKVNDVLTGRAEQRRRLARREQLIRAFRDPPRMIVGSHLAKPTRKHQKRNVTRDGQEALRDV
ncbi:MAG TPA: hypothetical protein VMY34_08445, partial [Acidimicrobiales bacterium]|nr:hypothetical protein [Acidimicrobiales bacterium]